MRLVGYLPSHIQRALEEELLNNWCLTKQQSHYLCFYNTDTKDCPFALHIIEDHCKRYDIRSCIIQWLTVEFASPRTVPAGLSCSRQTQVALSVPLPSLFACLFSDCLQEGKQVSCKLYKSSSRTWGVTIVQRTAVCNISSVRVWDARNKNNNPTPPPKKTKKKQKTKNKKQNKTKLEAKREKECCIDRISLLGSLNILRIDFFFFLHLFLANTVHNK